MSVISDFKGTLKFRFNMACLGSVKKFLTIERDTDCKNNIIKMHQKSCVEQLLNRFDISNCKGIATPVEKGHKLIKERNEKLISKHPHKNLVG